MLKFQVSVLCALSLLAASAKELTPANVTVGAHLETPATVTLSEAAPPEGVLVTITSSDPKRLLLSATAEEAGSATIAMVAHGGMRATPEFYVQGLADKGSVAYSATAPGFKSAQATVTLTQSAILIGGPYGNQPAFQASLGPRAFKVRLVSVALAATGASDAYVPQFVAGGSPVTVEVTNSNTAAGSLGSTKLTIPGGAGGATTLFKPAAVGEAILSVVVPAGFSAPAKNSSITANVAEPGLGVTDHIAVGENLEVGGAVSLGAVAGKGGLQVTLTSDDPEKLLLSAKADAKGAGTITITIPENGVTGTYFLQSLSKSGQVKYTASAPGYRSRTGAVVLAPSGLVMVGPLTLPEGQLLRPASEGGARQQGFITSLSTAKPTRLFIHTVQLDPVTHRAADITIQALRGGMQLPVDLKISDPSVGTIDARVTIAGGMDHAITQFTPLNEGSVALSVVVPPGFTEASNDGWLKVTVSK
jgi:hypothetical protein